MLNFIETGHKIQVRHGDICDEDVDAIVNAANEYLAHGGGVAGAISRSGGPAIQRESNAWVKKYGEVSTGNVAVTGPGNLICRCVIHAGILEGNSSFVNFAYSGACVA